MAMQHIKYAIYGNYGGSADTKGCFITALHCLVNEILKQTIVLIIIITISIICIMIIIITTLL